MFVIYFDMDTSQESNYAVQWERDDYRVDECLRYPGGFSWFQPFPAVVPIIRNPVFVVTQFKIVH